VTGASDGSTPLATTALPWPLEAIANRPRLAALLGAMCIAFSGIFYRWAEVTPTTGTVFRCLFGLPVLVAVAYLERQRFGPLPGRTIALALVAGVFFAGDLTLWHHAIEFVGAGLATVLGNLQVLVVGLVAWALLGERPSRSVLLALPIVLAGVALIAGLGGNAYGSNPVLGVVLGFGTALCYAGYLIVIRHGGERGDLRARDRRPGPAAVAGQPRLARPAWADVAVGGLSPDLDLVAAAAGGAHLDDPALAAGRHRGPVDGPPG
jgi:drug/metabolite transporter (DMT)-like permease